MLVAPNGKGKVPHDDFHEFAKGTVRPLADILRIVENHIFKDLLTLFKEVSMDTTRVRDTPFTHMPVLCVSPMAVPRQGRQERRIGFP